MSAKNSSPNFLVSSNVLEWSAVGRVEFSDAIVFGEKKLFWNYAEIFGLVEVV
jgi:hypothetical protein